MVSPNHIFVTVKKAMNDEILLNGGLKLYLDPSYRPEWNATVTGIVSSLPKIPKGLNKKGVSSLSIGDDVAFSYSVISDMRFRNNSDSFAPALDGSDFMKWWINSKGEQIKVFAVPGKISVRWTGMLIGKEGFPIDGRDLVTESEIGRWLAQFNFGGVQDFTFKNLLDIDGKDYWKVDPLLLLATKKNGQIISASDFIITKSINTDHTTYYNLENGLSLPPMSILATAADRGVTIEDYPELNIKKGEIVGFEPRFVNKYDLWGEEYWLIHKRNVLGTWRK